MYNCCTIIGLGYSKVSSTLIETRELCWIFLHSTYMYYIIAGCIIPVLCRCLFKHRITWRCWYPVKIVCGWLHQFVRNSRLIFCNLDFRDNTDSFVLFNTKGTGEVTKQNKNNIYLNFLKYGINMRNNLKAAGLLILGVV